MTNYLIQTCWNQKNMDENIMEYYHLLQDTCKKIEGLDFVGLYKPLTENWQWSYLLYLDDLEKWQYFEDEIILTHPSTIKPIQQKLTRINVERERTPKPKNIESLKYLEIEVVSWNGINVGLQKYYDHLVAVSFRKKDVWFMGQYSPASERFHWSHFYMYKSLTHMSELDKDIYSEMGRPQRLTNFVERLYKRYEPET